MDENVIATMEAGTTYTLTDTRDGSEYHVAKLRDGNVWMLDNLALGSDSQSYTLTPNDTNLPASTASWTLPQSGSWTSSDQNVATVDINTGKVTALAPGTTTITATLSNGLNRDIIVTRQILL